MLILLSVYFGPYLSSRTREGRSSPSLQGTHLTKVLIAVSKLIRVTLNPQNLHVTFKLRKEFALDDPSTDTITAQRSWHELCCTKLEFI